MPASPQYYIFNSTGTTTLDSSKQRPLRDLPSCTNATDAQLLLGFRASLDNGPDVLEDWEGFDSCSWSGIKCTNGRVVRM
jgi:hypothetical protein